MEYSERNYHLLQIVMSGLSTLQGEKPYSMLTALREKDNRWRRAHLSIFILS